MRSRARASSGRDIVRTMTLTSAFEGRAAINSSYETAGSPDELELAEWRADIAESRDEDAARAILEEVLERAADHRERELVPGELILGGELHFEAFDSGRDVRVEELRAEHQVHLADVRDRVDGVQVDDFHPRIRFLHGLTRGALGCRFVVLHEARRQGPEPVAGLDGTLADQDAVPICRETPHDHLGVLVVDGAAGVADGALQGIALGNAVRDGAAAGMAVLDQGTRSAYSRVIR